MEKRISSNSSVVLDEFFQALAVFGAINSREILKEAAAEIRQLISSDNGVAREDTAMQLHKACGRLSLFGVHTLRNMSREVRHQIEDNSGVPMSYEARSQMLEGVRRAETEVTHLLDEFEIIAAPAAEGRQTSVITSLFTLLFAGYLFGGLGFALTYTFMGLMVGAWTGLVLWLVAVILANRE